MESLHTKSSQCQRKEKQSRFEHTALHQSDGSKGRSVICGVINHAFHWELSVCGLCCPDFYSFLVSAHDLLFCWMDVRLLHCISRAEGALTLKSIEIENNKSQLRGWRFYCKPFLNRNRGSMSSCPWSISSSSYCNRKSYNKLCNAVFFHHTMWSYSTVISAVCCLKDDCIQLWLETHKTKLYHGG